MASVHTFIYFLNSGRSKTSPLTTDPRTQTPSHIIPMSLTVLIRHSHESKVRRWGRVQLQPSVKLWSRRYKAVDSCGPATAGWGMVSIPRDHWVMVSGQMLPIQLSVFDDVQYDTFDGHFDGCILAYIMCRGGIYQHPLQSGLKCGAWPLALALATHQWVPH